MEEHRMKRLLFLPLVLAGLVGFPGFVQSEDTRTPSAQTAPDNTGKNVRDREDKTLTPFDQSESEADRTLTQRIRQAVVHDDSLSTNAKNVKIITTNSRVTLRGPVASKQEKAAVASKAQQIAGADKVDDQLEITGK
jgi:hyperosmotically inducible periplasmic protein